MRLFVTGGDPAAVTGAVGGSHAILDAGRRGVVLRFGLLDGPGTGNDEPVASFGSTLDVRDAGRALLEALELPSGLYAVSREGGGVAVPAEPDPRSLARATPGPGPGRRSARL